MNKLEAEEARAFAAEWISAWNARDVERVLAHYSEDVEFCSPLVATYAGEPSGKLRGKGALRAYWNKALGLLPSLHFELVDVLAGADALAIYYRGHRGTVVEFFVLDDNVQVVSSTACYGI